MGQRVPTSSQTYLHVQADQAISCFSMVPRSADRPLLLVAGMKKTAGLEIFTRVEKRVHEALIKAEFCPYLEVRYTIA